MANGFFVTNAVAILMATAIRDAFDSDATGPAVIEIYSGTAPANADAALSGNTLLSRLNCSKPSAPTPVMSGANARITFSTIASDNSAAASGIATFFRILTKNGGTVRAQGTVGSGGTYDLVLNTASISAGSTVSISAATVDQPIG